VERNERARPCSERDDAARVPGVVCHVGYVGDLLAGYQSQRAPAQFAESHLSLALRSRTRGRCREHGVVRRTGEEGTLRISQPRARPDAEFLEPIAPYMDVGRLLHGEREARGMVVQQLRSGP